MIEFISTQMIIDLLLNIRLLINEKKTFSIAIFNPRRRFSDDKN